MMLKFYAKKSLITISFILITTALVAQKDEIELLRQRVIDDAYNGMGFYPRVSRYHIPRFEKAAEFMQSVKENGSWEDIDYGDTDNDWHPLRALNRILVLSHAYKNKAGDLYLDDNLLEAINKSLGYWYDFNPNCVNWYKNDIAKQMYLGVIGLLMQGSIDDTLMTKIINDQTEKPRMTGSNRTLLSTSVFYRGLMEKNSERITSGVNGVMAQVQLSDKEGIQPDYSFHQHGPYLYNGSYGNNFLRETLWLAAMVGGTKYAFTDDHIKILRDYYLKGTHWMIRGGVVDYNVSGRQVGRPINMNVSGEAIISQLNYFMLADPENSGKYKTAQRIIKKEIPQNIVGNKHFWRSDYTAHHRPKYFSTLKMCSKRTIGVEIDVNFENLLGHYTPYGLTYTYRRGDEYDGIFPAWDWGRLPGVTSPSYVPSIKGKYTQQTEFVGGVSDGTYAVSAMDLSYEGTEGKKSWFWFDNEWVALGAGIQSESEHPIQTGINQLLLRGEVLVDGKRTEKPDAVLNNPKWIWHDSVAYVFPDRNQEIKLEAKSKPANMHRIFGLAADSTYQADVFALWYDHGVKPKNADYQYIAVPGITKDKVAEYYDGKFIQILINTTELQAVTHKNLGITGIVFHKGGEYTLSNGSNIKVNKPCLIIINAKSKELTISDPTATLDQIELEIVSGNKVKKDFQVELPNGQYAGKSLLVAEASYLLH
ncbi:MAG: hypothetical protein JXQ96_22480 [Cyclobacteriaceae bacterium]